MPPSATTVKSYRQFRRLKIRDPSKHATDLMHNNSYHVASQARCNSNTEDCILCPRRTKRAYPQRNVFEAVLPVARVLSGRYPRFTIVSWEYGPGCSDIRRDLYGCSRSTGAMVQGMIQARYPQDDFIRKAARTRNSASLQNILHAGDAGVK